MAHLATSRGHAECFSCLISHDAQLDLYTFDRHESVMDVAKRSGKYGRIEQARKLSSIRNKQAQKSISIGFGKICCSSCEEKLAKEKHDRAHARNPVEQLIHSQIQRGYHLNIPTNRSTTNMRSVEKFVASISAN
ncbi:unnamed protein product [Rotaria magnacalcarata]|uniref:Uncharacterized protein n=8 Tax=Rotaria magnacalcarata TaxID=392030 RepID=A0A8S2YDG7_9BILA|nr:unnamed protein product [Rotaria magnacalcarata]